MGTGSRQRISRTPSGAPPCQVTEAFTPQVLDTVSTTRRDSHLPPPSRGVCHTSNRFLLCNQMSTRERREGCSRILTSAGIDCHYVAYPYRPMEKPAPRVDDGATRRSQCAFTLGAPTPSPSTDKWLSGRPPRPSRRQQGQPVPANKDDASDHSSPT